MSLIDNTESNMYHMNWGVIPVISYGHKDAYVSELGEDMESNKS